MGLFFNQKLSGGGTVNRNRATKNIDAKAAVAEIKGISGNAKRALEKGMTRKQTQRGLHDHIQEMVEKKLISPGDARRISKNNEHGLGITQRQEAYTRKSQNVSDTESSEIKDQVQHAKDIHVNEKQENHSSQQHASAKNDDAQSKKSELDIKRPRQPMRLEKTPNYSTINNAHRADASNDKHYEKTIYDAIEDRQDDSFDKAA